MRDILIGLAIGLWIGFVVMLLRLELEEQDGGQCGCASCCGGPVILPVDRPWVPAGDEVYYCSSNDQGRAFVADQGGAFVDDQGGAFVDDGPHAPAPTPDHLSGNDRSYHHYVCSVDDQGRAFVEDWTGRRTTVYMPDVENHTCTKVNGNATVIAQPPPDPYDPVPDDKDAFCMVAAPNSEAQVVTAPKEFPDEP